MVYYGVCRWHRKSYVKRVNFTRIQTFGYGKIQRVTFLFELRTRRSGVRIPYRVPKSGAPKWVLRILIFSGIRTRGHLARRRGRLATRGGLLRRAGRIPYRVPKPGAPKWVLRVLLFIIAFRQRFNLPQLLSFSTSIHGTSLDSQASPRRWRKSSSAASRPTLYCICEREVIRGLDISL